MYRRQSVGGCRYGLHSHAMPPARAASRSATDGVAMNDGGGTFPAALRQSSKCWMASASHACNRRPSRSRRRAGLLMLAGLHGFAGLTNECLLPLTPLGDNRCGHHRKLIEPAGWRRIEVADYITAGQASAAPRFSDSVIFTLITPSTAWRRDISAAGLLANSRALAGRRLARRRRDSRHPGRYYHYDSLAGTPI